MYSTRTTQRRSHGAGITTESHGSMDLTSNDGVGAPLSDWACINYIPATKDCGFVSFSPRKQQFVERHPEIHPVHDDVFVEETHIYLDKTFAPDATCVTVPCLVFFAHSGGITQTPTGLKMCGVAFTCNGRLANLQTLCLTAKDAPRLPSMTDDYVVCVTVLASAVNFATIKRKQDTPARDAFVFNNHHIAKVMLQKLHEPTTSFKNTLPLHAKGMVANFGVYPAMANLSNIAAETFLKGVEDSHVRVCMQLFITQAHLLLDRTEWQWGHFLFPDMLCTNASSFPHFSTVARSLSQLKAFYHINSALPPTSVVEDKPAARIGGQKHEQGEPPHMTMRDVMTTSSAIEGLDMNFSWDAAYMQLMEWKFRTCPLIRRDGGLFHDDSLMLY